MALEQQREDSRFYFYDPHTGDEEFAETREEILQKAQEYARNIESSGDADIYVYETDRHGSTDAQGHGREMNPRLATFLSVVGAALLANGVFYAGVGWLASRVFP